MTTAAVRTRTIRGDGLDLFVREWGSPDDSKATVVLVHGYPDTGEVWRPVAEALASRFHVVAHDVRGAGASGVPADVDGYRLKRLAADVKAVIDATSPGRPVHLVGHDWGSIQGWEAVSSPTLTGRIASYTSISGPCLDQAGTLLRDPRRVKSTIAAIPRSWYIAAMHLPGVVQIAWRTVLGPRWGYIVRRGEGITPDPDWPEATTGADGAHGVGLYRANMRERLRHPRPRRVDIPVQVVVPKGDPFVSPSYSIGIEQWVPNIRRREVAGKHWIIRSHPERVARWIEQHVDRVESGDDIAMERPPVVVVTGAGSGIGRAACLAFAERGAAIVAVDINSSAADRTAELCKLAGASEATSHVVDVSDVAAMEAFAKFVGETHGAADVVVNNAGIGMAGPLLETTPDDWSRIVGINLLGVVHGCRLLGRQMVERGEGGHIVNTASALAFTPSRSVGAYATTKAAVLMHTECLRAELASEGIGVSAVCPGFVDTGIAKATAFVGVDTAEQQRRRERADRLYKLRAFGPTHVADAIVAAVDGNRPVVPVAAEAHLGLFLSRYFPRILRRLARLDVT